MKYPLIVFLSLYTLLASSASCDKYAPVLDPSTGSANGNNTPIGSPMKIKIGSTTFTATLHDNATTAAFKAQLPMTVVMKELNGNEKYFDLPASLPTNASNPGTIHNGDLMFYGSKTLVLFYKGFSTSYNYTKLGRVNDPAGLAAAVGKGGVTVTFELQPKLRTLDKVIKRVGSQPSQRGPEYWFSATVRIDPLFQAQDPARVAGAKVTFESGARTAWHTHPLDQTLIVTSSCVWVQREGGPIEEIRPGDVVWFAPEEKHWIVPPPLTR